MIFCSLGRPEIRRVSIRRRAVRQFYHRSAGEVYQQDTNLLHTPYPSSVVLGVVMAVMAAHP